MQAAVSRKRDSGRRLDCEKTSAVERDIQRITGWDQSALREVGPISLHDRKECGAWVLVGLCGNVLGVELVIGFEPRGRRVRYVVGDQVQSLNAGPHTACSSSGE